VVRSGQPRTGRSLLEEKLSSDPEVSLVRTTEVDRDRGLEATSATTDQVVLEALGLLQLAGYP
jgi:hypothetical protein